MPERNTESFSGKAVTPEGLALALRSPEFARLVLDTIPAGVIMADAEGHVVAVNQEAADIWRADGASLADWGSARRGWWAESGEALRPGDWPLLKAALEGSASRAVVIDILRFDRTMASIVDSAEPLRDQDGRLVGAMAVAHDITAERRHHLFNRTLATINGVITSEASFDEVMQIAVRETVRAVGAESGVLYVKEDDGWAARWAYGLPDSLTGKHFVDEEVYYSVLAVESGGKMIINEPATDSRVHSSLIGAYGIRAILDVPLIIGEDMVGDFAIHHHDDRRFTDEEAEFARNVASSMSLALRNAKLLRDERHVAETLQEALLLMPETLPGVEIAHLYRSAFEVSRVGGDFYDVFEVESGTVGIVIGDISGKGVEAAAQVTQVKSAIRAYTFESYPPEEVLAKANGLLDRVLAPETFASVFYGLFTPESGRLVYCNAGHPPAIVRRSEALELLPSTAQVLGAFSGGSFNRGETIIGRGDGLVLYTDGIIEARGADGFYGSARLESVIRQRGRFTELPQLILDDVLAFSKGRLGDDIAILVITPRPGITASRR